MAELTIEQIQEVADALIWERDPSAKPPRLRDEDWNTGFAAGWNSACRQLAALLDPAHKLDTKPYHLRIREKSA
jgi:hypothetical protein